MEKKAKDPFLLGFISYVLFVHFWQCQIMMKSNYQDGLKQKKKIEQKKKFEKLIILNRNIGVTMSKMLQVAGNEQQFDRFLKFYFFFFFFFFFFSFFFLFFFSTFIFSLYFCFIFFQRKHEIC